MTLRVAINGYGHIGRNTLRVMAWHDNEWGFSNRMFDNSLALMAAKQGEAE